MKDVDPMLTHPGRIGHGAAPTGLRSGHGLRMLHRNTDRELVGWI
jgi:hypothetical protein